MAENLTDLTENLIEKTKITVPVVIALLRQDGKVLLGLRPESSYLGGFWEFPGGKVKWGEGLKEALVREVKEEINITVQVGSLRLGHCHTIKEDHRLLLLFYDIVSWQGQVKNLYHTQLEWVKPFQLERYSEMLPINQLLLPELLTILSTSS